MMDLTPYLLRLYPAAWRERYGDEFAALLEETPLSLHSVCDVLLGALDARRLGFGRISDMLDRLRRAEITIFCAYIAFVVSGLGFAKMTEYDDFADATRAHPAIGVAFNVLVAGAWIAFAAMLVGGLPLALVAARSALVARRWRILALLATPAFAFAAFVGYTLVLGQVVAPALHAGSGPTPTNVVLFLSLAAVFILAAIASTAGVIRAIAASDIPERLYTFARLPAAVAVLAMTIVTGALLAWGLGLQTGVPELFNGGDGILATNTAANWLANLAVMGLATAVAVWAAVRAFRQRPTPQPA
jgi:hypothetical protein